MSKSKIVNQIIKHNRAGVPVKLKPGTTVESSTPDYAAVGRFRTEGGGLSITRTFTKTLSIV